MTIIYEKEQLSEIIAAVQAGQTIAFPTDTVYGLGVISTDAQALERLKAAKGRPDSKPTFEEVMRQLDGRIDGIVKGTCGCMSASTIIDLSQDEVKVLREGPITKAQIEEALAR